MDFNKFYNKHIVIIKIFIKIYEKYLFFFLKRPNKLYVHNGL